MAKQGKLTFSSLVRSVSCLHVAKDGKGERCAKGKLFFILFLPFLYNLRKVKWRKGSGPSKRMLVFHALSVELLLIGVV